MKIVFFIVSILLILAVVVLWFPVRTKGVFHANLLKREAFLSIKILFVNISAKFYFLPNGKFSAIHNADMVLKMDTGKIDGMTFAKEMAQRMKINELDFVVDGGKQDDAYLTAMAISSASALVETLVSVFKPKIENSRIKIVPSYQSSEFMVSARINVGIRVKDALISYLKAKKEKQKGAQNA